MKELHKLDVALLCILGCSAESAVIVMEEIESLRTENESLRLEFSRISAELGLPPTIGPAPGELARIIKARLGD